MCELALPLNSSTWYIFLVLGNIVVLLYACDSDHNKPANTKTRSLYFHLARRKFFMAYAISSALCSSYGK